MRWLPLALLLPIGLAGCAGNMADYVGPRSDIIAPQLTRFGHDPRASQCVGERRGAG